MPLPASYTFPESSGTQLANPPWTTSRFIFVLEGDGSGHARVRFNGDDCIHVWNADSWPNDQYSQVQVAFNPPGAGADYVELAVRSATTTGSVDPACYLFICDGVSDAQIDVCDGSGGQTALITSSSVGFVSGDTFRLTASGTTIYAEKNGTTILSTVDTTYSSGSAGIGGYSTDGALLIANWQGGAAGGSPPGTHVVTGRGNFTVSSPTWLSTTIAGRPGNLTSGAAEPPNWYHVGMLTWATVHGAMVAYPVTRDMDLVQIPAGMTTVYYEFAAGVTATIVELSGP